MHDNKLSRQGHVLSYSLSLQSRLNCVNTPTLKRQKSKVGFLKIMLLLLSIIDYIHITLEQSRRQDKEYVILSLPVFCWLPKILQL